ncbi:MAG: S-adenosylmethionine:tRNA ribosyltransferase-isomerase, partial [Prevotella pallens]|nr:S-adenosylmethionine:tRNA ribosyltransferase-isomerase [Prevotella pallens]
MKLSQFKFNLPEEQVALYPHSSERVLNRADGTSQVFKVTRRDEARLMVVHKKSGTIDMYNNKKIKGEPTEEDYIRFKDVVNYFDEGDTFIFNDTKVFPARLYGTKEK